ncbi:MAG: flagellin N-terminal helical domain-containing protein [Peptoanaerobacter stomatis]|uniref:flagellin N-terminal helical domain-containing protein n=1 Tax=Peptoanaerobacter stomatis TaxID=796937 RepID=UPI003F9F03FE
MIINHNMMAQNSHRMMGINSNTMGKSTEKLSSGLRINRAADDAAGLSISEKMRGQIRGLTQASRNSQDAISVVQTAEGALDESHSILQRMRELAVQSANDSNVAIDRAAIQQEVSQLTDELDRIATTTQFNTMNLLDGSFKDKVFQVGANEGQNLSVTIDAMSARGLSLRAGDGAISKTRTAAFTSITALTTSIATLAGSIKDKQASIKTLKDSSISNLDVSIATLNESIAAATDLRDDAKVQTARGKLAAANAKKANANAKIDSANKHISGRKDVIESKNKTISELEAKISARGGVQVNTQSNASTSITRINDAISKVSKQRSDLGAIQNRMEHTIKNLDNSAENLQAAESRVRDVDMAKEMSEFTKKNILTQASQAMLAQANQLPQQILQLLR